MIKWSKMHRKNYDGSCENCGGKCTCQESIDNWELALDQLQACEELQHVSEYHKQSYKYLQKRIMELDYCGKIGYLV